MRMHHLHGVTRKQQRRPFVVLRRVPLWAVLFTSMFCLGAGTVHAQTETDRNASPSGCAPLIGQYKYFEQIQKKAYESDPAFMRLLARLRDTNAILESIQQTGKELEGRKDLPGATRETDSKETEDFIRRSLRNLRLPTCYENRYIYWMLTNYASQVDEARRSLRLPLSSKPKIASLPTTEINAYTYPAAGNRDNVIAFNSQLFLFAYQMTKVTLPTIELEYSSGKVGIDRSRTAAFRAIASDNDLRLNFTMALLEFLLLVDPETQPLAPSVRPSGHHVHNWHGAVCCRA